MKNLSRRELAFGAGAVFIGEALPRLASAQPARPSKTRLILLGTGGGTRPRKTRVSSSQVILVNEAAYVFDCGIGVTTQLARAGIRLDALRHVFITHHHSDHNAEYGPLLLIAWGSGLRTRVDTWGPPPLVRMTELFLAMNEYDIQTRTDDEGRVPFAPLIHPHELSVEGVVLRAEGVSVKCALVDHPPVTPAFAYRLDSPDRSIVISGDTKRSDALIELARGADVLVHEVLWPAAIDRMLGTAYNAAALKKSILGHHTPAQEVGRVAVEAGVKMLVLSHFVPSEDAELTDDMWTEAVRRGGYKGPIIVGRDLLEV
jgi:ribonuclease BN (tRNA processing enzyme)